MWLLQSDRVRHQGEMVDSSDVQERRWARFIGNMRRRAQWHREGLLLWLVKRPYLRSFPLPFPCCADVEMYEETQLATADGLAYDLRGPDIIGLAVIFEDLLFLRGKMGSRRCTEDESLEEACRICEIIYANRSKKTVMEKAKSAAVVDLLGPQGGMPKTKDKLMLLALALGLEKTTGTVQELSLRCKEALGRTCEPRRARPPTAPGTGGDGVMRRSLSSSSDCDSTAQVMRASAPVDPEHFERGASLIHGFTLWGKRLLEYQSVSLCLGVSVCLWAMRAI